MPAPSVEPSGPGNHIGSVENARGTVDNLVFINKVAGNLGQGLLVQADGTGYGALSGLQFYNNTVDNVTQEALILTNTPAAQVVNNVFYDGGGGGDNYLFADSSSNNFTAAANDFYMSNGARTGSYGSNAPSSNWNPAFMSPTTGNFQLSISSPLIDAGETLLVVPHDYYGIARPAGGNDLGAFEYH